MSHPRPRLRIWMHNLSLEPAVRILPILSASLFAMSAPASEPLDIDVGFGGGGAIYLPVDTPNSSARDRTVAVFPFGSSEYMVIAETANATGGVSPTFIRVSPTTGIVARNTVNLSVVGVTAACKDPVSGGFVLGMRDSSTNGNAIDFRKYDDLGIQDMSFGANGSGRFAYGAGLFERVAELNCHNGRFSAAMWLGNSDGQWTGNRISRGDMVGGTFGNAINNNPSPTRTTRTLGSGETDDGEVIFVNELDEDGQPLSIRVLQYATTAMNTQAADALVAIGDHCPQGLSSTVHRAHVDNLGRVHVAGSSTGTSTKFNWLMQFSVSDSGTIVGIRCGTRTFANFSAIPPSTTSVVEAFEFSGQSIYLLTTLATGSVIPDRSVPVLLRFRNSTLTQDLGFAPTIATAASNTTPLHRGRTLLLDSRPTVPRLVIGANREFLDNDEDPVLVRMIAAPLFANGYE